MLKKQKVAMVVGGGLVVATSLVVMLVLSWDTLRGFGKVLDSEQMANPPELVRVKKQLAGERIAPCALPALPPNAEVVAAHTYAGRQLDKLIDESNHPAGLVDVYVHSDKPMVLVLSAYEPTIWNLHWSAKTKLVGVYATGYYRQVVAGAPAKLPVVLAGYAEAKDGGCPGDYLSAGALETFSQATLGQAVTALSVVPEDGVLAISRSKQPEDDFLTSNTTPPGAFFRPHTPRAGQAGLDAAAEAGTLRPLTEEDRAQVLAVLSAAYDTNAEMQKRATVDNGMTKEQWLAYIVPLIRENSYVVTGPFTYPAGLYGGNLAYFIVPEGVPTPTGDPGHSQVIDLTEGTCTGGPC